MVFVLSSIVVLSTTPVFAATIFPEKPPDEQIGETQMVAYRSKWCEARYHNSPFAVATRLHGKGVVLVGCFSESGAAAK
ncbi:MAG: hypothetical protein BGO16_17065 [Nitrobacter sp. 62-23]|nr:MAG: hypothetical protein BGO16_17065 [Nitrobacter sp. 62-23]